MSNMDKLVEMVGENAEIRQGDVTVPVKVRSVNSPHSLGNATDTWQVEISPAEKEHGASWYARGWMAHASAPGAWGLRVPKDSTKCAICGKKIEGSDGRLKHMIGAGKYDSMRAVKWIDVARPAGDHERWAHPKCLLAVRNDKTKWPAGIVYVDTPEGAEQVRQSQALHVLLAQGRDPVDAHRAVAWANGREPAIISELLDKDRLVPMVGDVVLVGGRTFLIEATAWRIGSGACFSAKECATGARCEFSGGLRDVTLLVRNGKVIDKKYAP